MVPARAAFLALLLALALVSGAQANPHEFTLANGLRLIVKEDHRAPTVVHQVWYRAGSMDEAPGTTGVEHVRDAGRAGRRVHAARPIPYLMNDGGCAVALLHDQAQAVGQGERVRVRLHAGRESEGKQGG